MTILQSSIESFCALMPEPQRSKPANVLPFVPADITPPATPEPVAVKPDALTPAQIAEVHRIADLGRNEVIKIIRDALKRRSGKAWSVTGGRGTSWGWLKIEAPPARRTWGHRPLPHNPGGHLAGKENWEPYDMGEPDRCMSPADRAELGRLLGLGRDSYDNGESVPSQRDYQRVFICRALHGHAGPFTAEAQWD